MELQDLLAKSTRSDQSGLTEKLKALQLVEEMIMTQEKLMSNRRDGEQIHVLCGVCHQVYLMVHVIL